MSLTSVKSRVAENPSTTVSVDKVGVFRVADRHGSSKTIVNEYELSFVTDPSSKVDVTVTVVEVPCNEVSVETTLTVRPLKDSQDAVGVWLKVSVYVHALLEPSS